MSSRIRENPERLFEVFIEIAKPEENTDPFILQIFPTEYSDADILKSVAKFAFPCPTDTNVVDHFTFVLTDAESMYRFGFCRHATGAQTCLCIISFLPWYEVFYNLLNLLAELLNSTDGSIDNLLQSVYDQPIPRPDIPVTVVSGQQMFSFTAPDPAKLPSIPESRNLTEYFNAIDTDNMMKIFASMLNERRILIVSRKLSRLTACVHAASALIYPMHWQHLYIPVIPQHLLEYCSAPMPFIIGIHSFIYAKLNKMDVGDAVVVDADKNTVESEFDDLSDMPSDVIASLKKSLRVHVNNPKKSASNLGTTVSYAFLQSLIHLIGGYRDALRFRLGEPITFDPVAFVQSRPIHMQPFLEKVLQLQLFQQFINGRLDMLNCGQGFTDLFENQALLLGDKLNAQSRYKDWSANMKKQGKRFQKGSKVVWSRLQKSARPMMDTAVRSVRSQGHKAYKGIRSKIGHLNKDDDSKPESKSSAIRPRPSPQNRLAYSMVSLSKTMPRSSTDLKTLATEGATRDRSSKQYKLLNLEEKSLDDCDADLEYNRVSINLVNDPDIQRAMKKSISLEDVPSLLPETTDSETSSYSSFETLSPPLIQPVKGSSVHYDHLLDKENVDDDNTPVPPPRKWKGPTNLSMSSEQLFLNASENYQSSTNANMTNLLELDKEPISEQRFSGSAKTTETDSVFVDSIPLKNLSIPPRRSKQSSDSKSFTSNNDGECIHQSLDSGLPQRPPRHKEIANDNNIKPAAANSNALHNNALIQLDSADSEDDFDPLYSRSSKSRKPFVEKKRYGNDRIPPHPAETKPISDQTVMELFDPLRPTSSDHEFFCHSSYKMPANVTKGPSDQTRVPPTTTPDSSVSNIPNYKQQTMTPICVSNPCKPSVPIKPVTSSFQRFTCPLSGQQHRSGFNSSHIPQSMENPSYGHVMYSSSSSHQPISQRNSFTLPTCTLSTVNASTHLNALTGNSTLATTDLLSDLIPSNVNSNTAKKWETFD